VNRVTKATWITEELIKASPNKVFLFGDNLVKRGRGGQAVVMRGLPNCVGVPTKKYPSMNPGSFFTDSEYQQNCWAIDEAFGKIPDDVEVVVPEAGLGTGLAQLPQRAPRTYAYLLKRLAALERQE
jgi:hypothetical protein